MDLRIRSLSLWSYRIEQCANDDVNLTAPVRSHRLKWLPSWVRTSDPRINSPE